MDDFKRDIQGMSKMRGQRWQCPYGCCFASRRLNRKRVREERDLMRRAARRLYKQRINGEMPESG